MLFTAFIDLDGDYKILGTFDNAKDAEDCAVNAGRDLPAGCGVPGFCEHPDDEDGSAAIERISAESEREYDLERLTDFLDNVEKWVCDYATENGDYATGYDCMITEDPIRWRGHVREWVYANYPHLSEKFADRVWENIEAGFDSEWEYHPSEYASYCGNGCCIGGFDISEIEEQLNIADHDILKELHDKDVLDDLLDEYKGDLYISRSRRRVKNEETGRYEYVGRKTYKHDRGWHHFYGYVNPGGQWMAVIPAARMHEIVTETILQICNG